MTQEELKHIDERFENLKEFFIEKINNLTQILNNYIMNSDCRHKDQQTNIDVLYNKTNENQISIIRLEGDIKEIKAVKQTEGKVKDRGLKVWHFVLGLSIPTIFSVITFILTYKP